MLQERRRGGGDGLVHRLRLACLFQQLARLAFLF
jgi:hypothetical protein